MIDARKVTTVLVTILLCLIVLSLIASWLLFYTADSYWLDKVRHSFVRLFDVDMEANIPTWFSSSILLVSALILGKIFREKKASGDKYSIHWGSLALIFVGLSIDETAMLHEMTIIPLRAMFHLHGIFFYPWIILGFASLMVVTLFYIRFVFSLPRKIRNLFLLAAAIFAVGALGGDTIKGLLYLDRVTMLTELISTVEKIMQLGGTVIFIHGLLTYMALQPAQDEGAANDGRHK